jgi:hypothetical protein
VILGLAGFNHRFFEFLQGNTATNGIIIQAIGQRQRFWPLGTKQALAVIPDFIISGSLSMALGLTIVVWSPWFLWAKRGAAIFLVLFILLFLMAGGIRQIAFLIPPPVCGLFRRRLRS